MQPTQVCEAKVLFNLSSFCDTVIRLVDQGKPVDVILEDFSGDFDTVSHNNLLDRMFCIWLDRNRTWWVSSWPIGQAKGIIVNGFHHPGRWSLSGSPMAPFSGHFSHVFVDDLHAELEDVLSKFADDTR